MRSAWAKVVGSFLSVAVLIVAVMSFLAYRSPGGAFPDLEEAEAVPICTSYIEKVYGLRGGLSAPRDIASGSSVTTKPSGEQTLKASFYPDSKPQQGRAFECTVRPAGTGYIWWQGLSGGEGLRPV